jgi:hypothetical protein
MKSETAYTAFAGARRIAAGPAPCQGAGRQETARKRSSCSRWRPAAKSTWTSVTNLD